VACLLFSLTWSVKKSHEEQKQDSDNKIIR